MSPSESPRKRLTALLQPDLYNQLMGESLLTLFYLRPAIPHLDGGQDGLVLVIDAPDTDYRLAITGITQEERDLLDALLCRAVLHFEEDYYATESAIIHRPVAHLVAHADEGRKDKQEEGD